MRSIYSMEFGGPRLGSTWPIAQPRSLVMEGPRLGQILPVVTAIAPALITAGAMAYQTYTQQQIAEDMAKAAEERAAREQARADAEKAAAAAEAAKVTQEAQKTDAGNVLGIPKEYLLYGGIGVAGLIALAVALK